MLARLAVRNLVLIEELAIEFGPNFNVLTGETGGGKSMIIGALSLVLGGRASNELVRAGAKEAEVEALFEVSKTSPLGKRVIAAGLASDDDDTVELVVRRTIQEGRSRAYLNGRLSTAQELANLAPDLCDIASQHESVTLTDPATHLDYLDAFGKLDREREALSSRIEALFDLVSRIDAAKEAERARGEREEFLEFQVRELDDLDPTLGEENDLGNERSRLRHADKLTHATRNAADRLYDGDPAICDELGRLASELANAADLDGSLVKPLRAIENARAELSDAARELGRYADSVEANPARLSEVEDRLFRLEKVLRRHGPTTADVLEAREGLRAELDNLRGASDRIATLSAERDRVVKEVTVAARGLSKRRRDVAESLADAVGKELARLGMGRARVLVEVSAATHPSGGIEVDGGRLLKTGLDRVEFLIAPNPGEDPRPLRRIASGGELSRALLAIKRVLAEKGPVGLHVFDEVDTGVGGAIAEVIGRSIRGIAAHGQVLCITHLPQIAALADTHYVVEKVSEKGRTFTRIRKLDASERIEEIARMLGGVKVGAASRKAAEEMLGAARAN